MRWLIEIDVQRFFGHVGTSVAGQAVSTWLIDYIMPNLAYLHLR